jgi:uncharacterized membrane protein YjgN (DUF898 family)
VERLGFRAARATVIVPREYPLRIAAGFAGHCPNGRPALSLSQMTRLDASEGRSGGVRFLGRRRAYARLLARGAVLLMVTLGLYRFWLMTDVRRFLWVNTEIDGETLEYAGTPIELVLGFLAAITVLVPIYAGFFIAALDLGAIGQMTGLLAFLGLAVLGQYAIYRARRYRLTRTIFRGLRFTQDGSAWVFAFRAAGWWLVTALTLGLAYPFQLASLERYKMRHTFYGALPGRFAGAGWKLLLRGLPMWFLVIAPLALSVAAFVEVIDWSALFDAVGQGGEDVMGRVEGGNPALGEVIVFAVLMSVLSAVLAVLLYPVFQAVVLRWWTSGLRFGAIEARSKLCIRHVYGAYMRFLWWSFLFTIALGVLAIPLLILIGVLAGKMPDSGAGDIAATLIGLGGYVTAALGYSTIYRATVQLSLWQLGGEALQLSGVELLDAVEARGQASSPIGEGLADALNVGGY